MVPPTLPVVDVSPLRGADASARAATAAAIGAACCEWGFFYVTGYGAELQAQVDGVIRSTRVLFDVPAESKAALAASKSALFRGCARRGIGSSINRARGAPRPAALLEPYGSLPIMGAPPLPSNSLLCVAPGSAVAQNLACTLRPLANSWTGVGGAHNCSPVDGSGPDLKESFLLGAPPRRPCLGWSAHQPRLRPTSARVGR